MPLKGVKAKMHMVKAVTFTVVKTLGILKITELHGLRRHNRFRVNEI